MLVTSEIFCLKLNGHSFALPFQRSLAEFGRIKVDHRWIRLPEVYGQRGRKNDIPSVITSLYQEVCSITGALADPETAETILLARLLPRVRSLGAQQVFTDARLKKEISRDGQPTRFSSLDDDLKNASGPALLMTDFQVATRRALGTPNGEPEVLSKYEQLSEELLADARAHVSVDVETAVGRAEEKWRQFERRIGRRAGQREAKQALNMLSYECRAAYHRCYSVAWMLFLDDWMRKGIISEKSFQFLRFWHTEVGTDRCAEGRFRLFHGHIVGLHPCGAMLASTPTGRTRIGHWLANPDSQKAYGQLLSALEIAAWHHASLRDAANADRRGEPC